MKNVIYIDLLFFRGEGPRCTSVPLACTHSMRIACGQRAQVIRTHWGELLHRVPSQPPGHATHRWWGRSLTLLAMPNWIFARRPSLDLVRTPWHNDTVFLGQVILILFQLRTLRTLRLGRKEGPSTACPNSCGEKCFGFNDFASCLDRVQHCVRFDLTYPDQAIPA